MKSKAILILGAGGFVGKQLINCLSQNGYSKIHAVGHHVDRFPPLPGVYYHSANIDNVSLLNDLLPECQQVFHLACASTPGSSVLGPVFEIEHNLLPTLRFLEVMKNYPHVSLVYLSTGGALYGNAIPVAMQVQEQTPPAPLSYYGAGKAALEHFITAFCNQQQRSSVILRPANFYGPLQSYKPGFGIVPTIFNCLSLNQPLQIWGDGEVVRDYLFITDFIELCLTLAKSPPTQIGAKIYNVGSQQGTSLNGLCDLIEKITGESIQRQYHISRNVDVQRIVLDCSRIYQDYHWTARTDLLTGLDLTWHWFKNRTLKSETWEY